MYKQFMEIGRDLFLSGLISSHGGNMSVLQDGRVHITASGSMLGRLCQGDVVETGVEENDGAYQRASSELLVHRAVYRQSGYGAVLHAHPPYTVALSFTRDKIEPIDSEAAYLFKQVPVITARQTIGSEEVADKLPAALQQAPVAVLRGHGSFAVGRSLEEAFQYTTALELAAKIIWLSNGYRP